MLLLALVTMSDEYASRSLAWQRAVVLGSAHGVPYLCRSGRALTVSTRGRTWRAGPRPSRGRRPHRREVGGGGGLAQQGGDGAPDAGQVVAASSSARLPCALPPSPPGTRLP